MPELTKLALQPDAVHRCSHAGIPLLSPRQGLQHAPQPSLKGTVLVETGPQGPALALLHELSLGSQAALGLMTAQCVETSSWISALWRGRGCLCVSTDRYETVTSAPGVVACASVP